MMAHYAGDGKPFSCEEGPRFEVIEPEVEEEYFAVEMPPEHFVEGVWQPKDEYDRREAELSELRGYEIPLRDAKIDELAERVALLQERLEAIEGPPRVPLVGEQQVEALYCGLCGHLVRKKGFTGVGPCGWAFDGTTPLCHADDHSCYQRWTLYGERP